MYEEGRRLKISAFLYEGCGQRRKHSDVNGKPASQLNICATDCPQPRTLRLPNSVASICAGTQHLAFAHVHSSRPRFFGMSSAHRRRTGGSPLPPLPALHHRSPHLLPYDLTVARPQSDCIRDNARTTSLRRQRSRGMSPRRPRCRSPLRDMVLRGGGDTDVQPFPRQGRGMLHDACAGTLQYETCMLLLPDNDTLSGAAVVGSGSACTARTQPSTSTIPSCTQPASLRSKHH